jgi:hypothetical protein
MLKVLFSCALAIGVGVCNSIAAERQIGLEVVHVNIPGTAFKIIIDPAETDRDSTAPSPALIAAITNWLSFAFGLPKISEAPFVTFVAPATMVAHRHRGLASDHRTGALVRDSITFSREQSEVVAFYDDEARTIYLPEGWSGRTAAELSIIVHEMVHHIQNLARLKYECPEAREKLAFTAQERWLALFGRDLTTEFGIDSFTLLVRTNCLY